MDSLNHHFMLASCLHASHAADKKFPSSSLNFSQKNIELYREIQALYLGFYYV